MKILPSIAILLTLLGGSTFAWPDWMSHVPGDTLISKMSIPGTHDSYALYGGVGWTKCQEWDVPKQLRKGIRFFDLRFRRAGTGFHIYHGPIYQHKIGEDAFNEITNFLREQPTETVLVSYQEEGTPSMSGSSSFQTILNSYVRRYRRWIYGNNTVIPRLEDVRGKMVFIDNKCSGNFGINCYRLNKKDDWNHPTYEDKTRGVKTHLEAARQSSGSELFLTYCSYSDAPGNTNYQVARGFSRTCRCGPAGCTSNCRTQTFSGMTNFVAFELIDKPKASYGVVIMDYPTMGAIGATIQHNPGLFKVCAILENSDRDTAEYIADGRRESLGGNDKWNDKIEYALLPKACYLKAWEDMHYQGELVRLHRAFSPHRSKANAKTLGNKAGSVGSSWTRRISSYHCLC